MIKMLKAVKLLFEPQKPLDHTETDKLVNNAIKETKVTLKKINVFNSRLEKTQTYFIAKAMGRVH